MTTFTKGERLRAFWKKVDKRERDSCWEWLGAKISGGYGYFWDGSRMVLAHRYSWELVNGRILEGLSVLHKCNNPACVNPNHLYLGNKCDNAVDLKNSGFVSMKRRLTSDQVINMRKDYTISRFTYAELGRKYGVFRSNVRAVVQWETYKEVGS